MLSQPQQEHQQNFEAETERNDFQKDYQLLKDKIISTSLLIVSHKNFKIKYEKQSKEALEIKDKLVKLNEVYQKTLLENLTLNGLIAENNELVKKMEEKCLACENDDISLRAENKQLNALIDKYKTELEANEIESKTTKASFDEKNKQSSKSMKTLKKQLTTAEEKFKTLLRDFVLIANKALFRDNLTKKEKALIMKYKKQFDPKCASFDEIEAGFPIMSITKVLSPSCNSVDSGISSEYSKCSSRAPSIDGNFSPKPNDYFNGINDFGFKLDSPKCVDSSTNTDNIEYRTVSTNTEAFEDNGDSVLLNKSDEDNSESVQDIGDSFQLIEPIEPEEIDDVEIAKILNGIRVPEMISPLPYDEMPTPKKPKLNQVKIRLKKRLQVQNLRYVKYIKSLKSEIALNRRFFTNKLIRLENEVKRINVCVKDQTNSAKVEDNTSITGKIKSMTKKLNFTKRSRLAVKLTTKTPLKSDGFKFKSPDCVEKSNKSNKRSCESATKSPGRPKRRKSSCGRLDFDSIGVDPTSDVNQTNVSIESNDADTSRRRSCVSRFNLFDAKQKDADLDRLSQNSPGDILPNDTDTSIRRKSRVNRSNSLNNISTKPAESKTKKETPSDDNEKASKLPGDIPADLNTQNVSRTFKRPTMMTRLMEKKLPKQPVPANITEAPKNLINHVSEVKMILDRSPESCERTIIQYDNVFDDQPYDRALKIKPQTTNISKDQYKVLLMVLSESLSKDFTMDKLNDLLSRVADYEEPILARALVEFIEKDGSPNVTINIPYMPPLPYSHQAAIAFLKRSSNTRSTIYESMMSTIEVRLFSLRTQAPPHNVCYILSKFYAILCHITNSKDRLKMFCVDALYCLTLKACATLYAVLEIWPFVLPGAKYKLAEDPLVFVMVYLMMTLCRRDQNKTYNLQQKLSKYEYDLNDYNDDRILKFLMDRLKGPLDKTLIPAFIIFGKRCGADWCCKHIVTDSLLPLIDDPSTASDVKAFALRLIGPLVKPFPANMNLNCQVVVKKLALNLHNAENQAVEDAAIYSMHAALKKNHGYINKEIRRWKPKHPLSEETKRIIDRLKLKKS